MREASLPQYVANGGTTVRFLAAMIGLADGEFRLDGTARIRRRNAALAVERGSLTTEREGYFTLRFDVAQRSAGRCGSPYSSHHAPA